MTVRRFAPVDPVAVLDLLAGRVEDLPRAIPRVLIDGPSPHGLADDLAARMSLSGRPALRIRDHDWLRDASVRLEYGHHDVESRLRGWIDVGALEREVFEPLAGPDPHWLPELRDPVTNRATRAARLDASPGSVLIVSGSLLIGQLPADLTVHLAVSPGARRRRTDPDDRWLLEAYDAYDAEIDPLGRADVVIRADDPAHPAIWVRDPGISSRTGAG